MTADAQRTNAVLTRYRQSLLEFGSANLAKRWSIGQGALVSSMFFMLFLAMFEPALMFPKLATASTLGGSLIALRWIPLPGLAIQSWAIHRLLSLNTPPGVRPRGALVLLRLISGCLPLFGVIAIPIWDQLCKRLPSWGFRGTPNVAPLALAERQPGNERPLGAFERRRLARIVPLGSLLLGGFLTYFVGAWFESTGRLRRFAPSNSATFSIVSFHSACGPVWPS